LQTLRNRFETMFQFVVWVFGWMILLWGIRVPKVPDPRTRRLVPF
jgi:hypothetical protein